MRPGDRRIHHGRLIIFGILLLVLGGCTSPVRAVRVSREAALRDLTRSVVTTGELSWPTQDVLRERGLDESFLESPEVALLDLHQVMVVEKGDLNLLFALAELSFLHGQHVEKPEHFMAAAVYAYAFLFPDDGGPRPDPFDPRLRSAADLYNWSLTAALSSKDGLTSDSEVVPRGGTFELPFGPIEVAFDPAQLRAGNRELFEFIPVAELEVHGMAMRYRWPGIGAPLAASTRLPENAASGGDMLAPRLKVPLTALLRIAHARRGLVDGQPLSATLELHLAWDDDSVTIAGESVPLENDPTAALALTFTGIPIRQLEIFGFLGRLTGFMSERPPLVSSTPYRPGLIPVVFVHGTASSAVRWAELYNRVHADPEIRKRYQFWFFQYDSDNPIAISALRLRESLGAAVSMLDPEGRDPALREMVLIGHSQGGLLVKMQSIDSGDRIWNSVSKKPLDELKLTDETRDLLRSALFVEPLPEFSRVIFISTPHRGSFIAGYRIIANLTRRLTTLPFHLAAMSAELARNRDYVNVSDVPTAVDNMSPNHPFIHGLQEVPVDPSIVAHSIISVKGSGPVEEGDDGVVKYKSARIEEAVSEVVVRSPHSCQGHPQTMQEVRRILLLHAAGFTNGGLPVALPESSQPAS